MGDFRYRKVIHYLILGQLRKGERITLKVSGKSMRPLIEEGDTIHVERFDPRALSIGNIITYEKNGAYFTHRVLWVRKKGNRIRLITKGDNEIDVDPLVSSNHIVGKAVAIERANRTLDLQGPFWRLLNLFLSTIFLMETISILFYRFAAGKFIPSRTFVHVTFKPSHLYRRLRKRGLNFATRIIV
jgi:signal peptidase I